MANYATVLQGPDTSTWTVDVVRGGQRLASLEQEPEQNALQLTAVQSKTRRIGRIFLKKQVERSQITGASEGTAEPGSVRAR